MSKSPGRPKHLAPSQSIQLLESLRETVSSFAEREAALERDYRNQTFVAKREMEEACAAEEAQLEVDLDESERFFAGRRARSEERNAQRTGSIIRAHASARQSFNVQAEGQRGSKISNIQQQIVLATRDKENAREAASASYENFKSDITEDRERFLRLKREARASFRGYWGFLLKLSGKRASKWDLGDLQFKGSEANLASNFRSNLDSVAEDLGTFRRHPLPALFKFIPFILILLTVVAAGIIVASQKYWDSGILGMTGIATAVLIAIQIFGKIKAAPIATSIAENLERSRRTFNTAQERAKQTFDDEIARVEQDHAASVEELEGDWGSTQESVAEMRSRGWKKLDAQKLRLGPKAAAIHEKRISVLDQRLPETIAGLRADSIARATAVTEGHAAEEQRFLEEYNASWAELQADWQSAITPVYQDIETRIAAAAEDFPAWDESYVESWQQRDDFIHSAQLGHLTVDVAGLASKVPQDERLALPGAAQFDLPVSISLPSEGSLLLETNGPGRDEQIGTLNNLISRLLATTPPGKLKFTIIDPVGLGENFAGLMHLADYEDSLINNRIWTQKTQIEEKLGELNEHIEKIIQMYLRNEYQSITEYNEVAGNIAEKYNFLIVADFPSNFSELAIKRLMSIAASGGRCGLYTLMLWDHRQQPPNELVPDELIKHSINITTDKNGVFHLAGAPKQGVQLHLAPPPSSEIGISLIHKVGKASTDSNRVEVPFSHVTPDPADYWKNETTDELRIPIGRTGATKLQYLAIGKGTRQHALLAGKTGSGKSTLFHIIVTNLALSCSPEEVEFYLIDFKKGVEFKTYATNKLPHARVIAIESDREFGLSVLQRVDDELKRRGDLFRELGAQDLGSYKRNGGEESMPRTLLMIDEFQEYFTEEDRISQDASVLLDRIVRQGRAFGIHVILGSQTLGGAYSLNRTTMGQMVIRVALQCNEADAFLIMDESNPAPRLLTRPGEGIYNDSAGAVVGNSPFQAVWLPEDVRDQHLAEVQKLVAKSGKDYPAPIVFEGNSPADVRENPELSKVLRTPRTTTPAGARAWLGAPNSIKGPTEATFYRQSGNHLLCVGQRDDASLAMTITAMISIAAQYPDEGAEFLVLDGTAPGTTDHQLLQAATEIIPQKLTLTTKVEAIAELGAERKARAENNTALPIFVFIIGLQKFKKLRHEDDFDFSFGDDDDDKPANPGAEFNDIVMEGSAAGLHLFVCVDTFNNVNRFFSRKALSEFEMRILFQMSANDSAALADTPKASTLGMHRALLYNDQQGSLETFRPYALPDKGWLEEVAQQL
ncbi:MAG: S-DNA-T family DNA segregation ATPase FtsK/SpoIIIE [Pseudoalteromonas tetraodonis]